MTAHCFKNFLLLDFYQGIVSIKACKAISALLTLNSTGNNALDYVFLTSKVENNNRDNAQHDERHNCACVGVTVAAVEVLNMNRYSFEPTLIKDKVWK